MCSRRTVFQFARWSTIVLLIVCRCPVIAQTTPLQTEYVTLAINGKGYITSIRDRLSGKEYVPKGRPSALLSLYESGEVLLPQVSSFKKGVLSLTYPNGSEARIQIQANKAYLKFRLLSLSKNDKVDNIIWGPYKLTISKLIGDIFSVVRDDAFAVGIMGLDDNTTSGPPTDGDMSFMYYYIHSPDPSKYPLPAHLKEGQTFPIGGDGVNDVAFYSQPEEYFRMNYGNGAKLEPAYGSSICMHSRNRRKEQMIRFPPYPDDLDGKANSSRYQLVTPADAGYIGSSIAFYACPDSLGLNTIERIVLDEGLPHPEIEGRWVKYPAAYRPDIAWWGVHDSLISYAERLGIQGVQDEGYGEYYPNPADRWGKRQINFKGQSPMSVPAFGALAQQHGIRYGLHTLCEFLQPDGNSDVSPVPSDSLAIMQRTFITKDIDPDDTVIMVADTAHFSEFGGWEGNHTNVLKIGKELIEYNGITTTPPYTFLHVKRGYHHTVAGAYRSGTVIVKLQPNCYRGFAPDIDLQDRYAEYYGKWLTEGKMDYIDFDGLESCMYQGHGQYSFKRFFRNLFAGYAKNGGRYLRVMGSAVQEGNWHYMSVCNVGGGDHMFSPVLNKWGIEGKDMRYVLESSYFPATFGIQAFESDWSLYDAENLEAKSIGWDATYMLGLSEDAVERCGEKEAIFKAYRTWEDARAAGIFTSAWKQQLKDLNYKFHLEERGGNTFFLYPIKETRFSVHAAADSVKLFRISNAFKAQGLQFAARLAGPKGVTAEGVSLQLDNGQTVSIRASLHAGEFLIADSGGVYRTDRNRKKLEKIGDVRLPRMPSGTHQMRWNIIQAGDPAAQLQVVVSAIGEARRVNSTVRGTNKTVQDGGLQEMLRDVKGSFKVSALSPEGEDKSGRWDIKTSVGEAPGQPDAMDGTVTCTLTEGIAKATAVSVSFDFAGWSRSNYVLVPAVIYNGNRYRAIGNGYNPDYPKDMYYNPRVPLTISNNPRLQLERGKPSLVELQTGNASTPAMCFFSPALKKGCIVLMEQATRFGNSGMTIVENAAQDSCSFRITAPAIRTLAAGFGDFHPSGDKAPDWKAGDALTLPFRLYVFTAQDIPDLLKKFMKVRKQVTGPNHPRDLLPMSKEFELGTAICKDHWSENPVGNYYTPENSPDFQLGWVSGMINTYGMLALNDEKERRRVGEELDFVVEKLQGPSGYFYGGITADGKIRPEKMNPGFPEVQAMVRKNSDALFWLMKHLLLLKAQGYSGVIKPRWENAARQLALAFTRTWEKDGQFGQYIAPRTGRIAVFNSTAGAIAPAGLVLASRYFKEPVFLNVARAAANYYYERDVVKQGLTGGDCGDISQDANSESAFGFLESLMALYYATGDKAWLQKAAVEAALCASWTLSYDPVFPAGSQIGRLDGHMAGAVWASIQNKHAAPGICEASGDYLFKLYRATGNPLYADLIRDIQHAHAEAVNMPPDHITTHNLIGSSMERIQPSDAEGWGSVGNFINTRNSWTETNGVLMALELPGVYYQTDTRRMVVFDHITVTRLKEDASGVDLLLENKTAYDANVSVMAETSREAAIPMGYTQFLKWPRTPVKAGGRAEVHIVKTII